MGYLSPPPNPAPVIVYKDTGGLVSDYEAQTALYRRQNREVRLHECRSACTLALSLPNVCVYPDAQVKFHQAYNALTQEVDLGVSAMLFKSYPAPVQARLGYLTRQYKVLSGRELIALGMRNCNPGHDDGVEIASRKDQAPAAVAQAAEPPREDPLQNMAKSVKAAVAKALHRPEGEPSEALAFADRSPAPLPPMAGLSQEIEIPLPPRRPDLHVTAPTPAEAEAAPAAKPAPVVVASPAPEPAAKTPERRNFVPRLMQGATPILGTGRFYQPAERQADKGSDRHTSGG